MPYPFPAPLNFPPAAAYKNMTPAQVTAWQNYAATQTKHDPKIGKTYNPSAIAAFTSLASMFLQVIPADQRLHPTDAV